MGEENMDHEFTANTVVAEACCCRRILKVMIMWGRRLESQVIRIGRDGNHSYSGCFEVEDAKVGEGLT